MSIFGKNKNAIVFTNLIVKVRKYENQKPYFSFHDQPAISDETKAQAVAEKLNKSAQHIEIDGILSKFAVNNRSFGDSSISRSFTNNGWTYTIA